MSKDPENSFERAIRELPLPVELTYKIYRYSQDAWIREVASLMGDIYRVIAKMLIFMPDDIAYPPHTLDMDKITGLGLSEDVISLMQQLPYFEDTPATYNGHNDFVFFASSGNFLNYRNPPELGIFEGLRWSRRVNDPRLKPWHIPLNHMAKLGAVMIISMRSRTVPKLYI